MAETYTSFESKIPLKPSWEESSQLLTQPQRLAAEVSFSIDLLSIIDSAVEEKFSQYDDPDLQSGDVKRQYLGGAIGLYNALQLDKNSGELEHLYDDWNNEIAFLGKIIEPHMQMLKAIRDNTYGQAINWDKRDRRKIFLSASKQIKKLPFENRSDFAKDSHFKPFGAKEYAQEVALTGGMNILTYLASLAPSIAGGAAAVALNPLSQVDTKTAAGFLAISYGFWGAGLYKSCKANLRQLESTGTSTSILSKSLYDMSKQLTPNAFLQAAASYFGFTLIQALEEIPFYAASFPGPVGESISQIPHVPELPFVPSAPDVISRFSDANSRNNEFAFLAGANMGAAAWAYTLGTTINRKLRNKD